MSSDIESYIFDLSRELRIEDTQGVFGNELELIALIRNCPFLYDRSRKDFKDSEKKETTWKAIANVMHSTVSDCQTRWKNLREQYGKIRRSIKAGDPEAPKLMQWEFLDDMKFLDQYIRSRSRCLKRNDQFKTEISGDALTLENFNEENYTVEWLDEPKSIENRERKLINLVKLCPLLYDHRHIDNKDHHKKEMAWLSIGKALGSAALDCKTRWKTLRERYARERKSIREDPEGYKSAWEYYEDMTFLDKHIKPRRNFRLSFRPILPKPENFALLNTTSSGVILSPQLTDEMNFQVQKLEFIEGSFSNTVSVENGELCPLSPTGSEEKIENNKNVSVLNSILSPSSSMGTQDEDDLFGQSIAAELKRIHGRRKKMRLKANIFKLLCEAESEDST